MVTNFVRGKSYKLSYFERVEEHFEWFLPFSYAKIFYTDGTTIEINGYNYFHYRLNEDETSYVLFVVQNNLNERYIVNDINQSDVPIAKIEFVFDYFDESPTTDVTEELKNYCNPVSSGSRALVSVFDHLATTPKWISLPCPSDYQGSSSTLVDSARNANGVLIGQVIKSNVAKVELKWNYLTVDEYKKIAQLFEPEYYGGDTSAFMRAVSFFDVIKGGWNGSIDNYPDAVSNKCKVFYTNDRKVQFAKIVLNDNGSPKGYSGVSLNLIDTGKIYGETNV